MTSLSMGPYLKRITFGLGLLSGLVSANSLAQAPRWQPVGISGGGGMFAPIGQLGSASVAKDRRRSAANSTRSTTAGLT